jgi:hypothetical protein
MSEFYCGGNIDARDEYNQSIEERLEEHVTLTDVLDELTAASRDIDGSMPSPLTVDKEKLRISRQFNYFESDKNPGCLWPLVEKSLEIKYELSKTAPTSETYTIILGTIIHQSGVTKEPILNRYEIEYYGPKRQSLVTTIEEPNLIDAAEPNYIRRPTTPYDQMQLFEQLQQFAGLLAAEALDDSHAS